MQRNAQKSSFNFGSMLTFLLLLLLIAGALLLLFPQYREYRKKKEIETQKSRENDTIQSQRNEQMQINHDLRSSPDANEKVCREKFNLVEDQDIVIKFPAPEQKK